LEKSIRGELCHPEVKFNLFGNKIMHGKFFRKKELVSEYGEIKRLHMSEFNFSEENGPPRTHRSVK
jgi:hypothetical protein